MNKREHRNLKIGLYRNARRRRGRMIKVFGYNAPSPDNDEKVWKKDSKWALNPAGSSAKKAAYHATGVGFHKDESTTKAVLGRMRELGIV